MLILNPVKLVPEEDVLKAFEGTDFGCGPEKFRILIADCLLKISCDFGSGSTILRICRELELVNKKSITLTKKGKRYLYGCMRIYTFNLTKETL